MSLPRSNSFSQFLFIGLLLAMAWNASASDFHSPRLVGLAGSSHAGPILNDSIYLNPSYASFLKSYSVSGSFLAYEDRPETIRGRSYGIAIHDGRTEMFQAGLGYSVRNGGSTVHLGAAKSFVQQWGFGIGGKMFFSNSGFESFQDMSISTTFVANQWLQTALIIDNLIAGSRAKTWGNYREVILGTKIVVDRMIVFYLDPHWNPDGPGGRKLGYEVGLELELMSDLFFRAGMFQNSQIPYESKRGRGIGMGIGWAAPKISLDYGFGRVLETTDRAPVNSVHTFGATVYF